MNTCIYGPYGHLNTVASLPLLGFTGERIDSGQSYLLGNGYRAYNPSLMRFQSPDSLSPFGRGGRNAYGYCVGDPINHVDSSGHFAWINGPISRKANHPLSMKSPFSLKFSFSSPRKGHRTRRPSLNHWEVREKLITRMQLNVKEFERNYKPFHAEWKKIPYKNDFKPLPPELYEKLEIVHIKALNVYENWRQLYFMRPVHQLPKQVAEGMLQTGRIMSEIRDEDERFNEFSLLQLYRERQWLERT